MSPASKHLRLPKRLFQSPPAFLGEFQFRRVKSIDELEQAGHLVYLEYRSRDYIPAIASEVHFSLFQALPTTVTFVAIHPVYGVLGAVTLIQDSPLGLPMDKIYRVELADLRAKGQRLAEVGLLATNEKKLKSLAPSKWSRLLFLFFLYRAMYDYFRGSTQIDDLVACFHPRHDFIYEFLGFAPFGDLRSHESVNGSPAVARRLNKIESELHGLLLEQYQHIMFYFDHPVDASATLKLNARDVAALFSVRSPAFARADASDLAYITSLYGENAFDAHTAPVESDLKGAAPMNGLNSFSHPFDDDVRRLSNAFETFGLKKGDLVAVMAGNGVEWEISKAAASLLGAAAIGIPMDISQPQIRTILRKYRCKAAVVRSHAELVMIDERVIDDFRFVILLEPEASSSSTVSALFESMYSSLIAEGTAFHYWDAIMGTSRAAPSLHGRPSHQKENSL